MSTTITPQGDSITSFFVNKPFTISFDVSSTYAPAATPTYQLCNSYAGLAPYVSNGSNFQGSFSSTGYKQFVQVDALIPTGTSVVTTYRGSALLNGASPSFPAWDSNGRMYFSDNDRLIYRMTSDTSYEVFAGQVGTAGFTDGDRLTTARFTIPRAIAFDSSGDMYVAMQYNIRKISMSTGQVTTVAGPSSSTTGAVDGTGSAVRFNGALTIRPEYGGTGNFLVGDYANHCIRKVTPGGTVTTVIGGLGASGYTNGTGTAARFDRIVDFVYSASGDMFVADQYNFRIRKVTPSYAVTTYAGNGSSITADGPLLSAGFGYPAGIDIDSSGTLYVPEFFGQVIRRIQGSNVTTWAGQVGVSAYVDGGLTTARFQSPQNLRVYQSSIYVVDSVAPYRMRAITTATSPGDFPFISRPDGYVVLASSQYPITVASRIDVSWTSVGGVLQLYKYEPFSNTFTAKPGVSGDTMTYSSTSTELLGYMTGTGTSQATFRGTNGATVTYPYSLNLWVRANSNGAVVDDVSTSVVISPARIVYSPCNSSLVFYRNEPASPTTFSLVSSAASNIYSATTLPAGLSFTRTASNSFALTGTPTVQTITSNYSILGQDTSGRTYTTQVSMVVNPERLVIDVSGTTDIQGVTSNAPIQPVSFSSRFPPYSGFRAMTYVWSAQPPAGIQFRDACGTALFGTSVTLSSLNDASFGLTLSGTITSDQVRAFADANVRTYSLTLTGSRSAGGAPLSPSRPTTITFTLAPVLLFSSNVPRLYVNLPVSNWEYSAKTHFADVSVSSIQVTAGFLPDGLVGTFDFIQQTYTISGTPTTAASYGFTLLATAGSYSASLPVSAITSNDVAYITTTADTCFNFIQYRDLSNAKSGYYRSPIHYTVSSDSGCNVTLTGANLPAGVSLAPTPEGYDLSGVPMVASGATTATLTATVTGSGATATKQFQYSVSAERITLDASAFSFFQNVPIPPTQVSASAFSEQPILRFSATGLPPALTVTNTGLVSGTVEGSTNGSFTVSAFTASSSGSKTFTYSVSGDAVLLVPSVYSLTTAPGCNVSIPITGYSLSSLAVSNYRFQTAFPYGLGINGTSGLLSGALTGITSSPLTFTLLGSAGLVDGSLVGTVTTANLTVNRAQMLHLRGGTDLLIYASDDNGATWSNAYTQASAVATTVGTNGSNLYMVPTSTGYVLRSTTGASYPTAIPMNALARSPFLSAVVNKPGTSTWWIAGTQSNVGLGDRSVYLFTSTDDGLTWDDGAQITTNGFVDRAGTPTPPTPLNSAYLNGVAMAYKDGVLLLGGDQVLRSTDEGASWTPVSTGFLEVADFSVEHETVWIAAGTDTYPSRGSAPLTPVTLATSLRYSTDFGATWSPVVGDFTMAAFQVEYGNGVWLASGFDRDATTATGEVRSSYDGVTWTTVTSIPSYAYTFGTYAKVVDPPVGLFPIARDDTDWKVLRAPADGTAVLYTHPDAVPMTTGWTSQTITSQFPGISSSSRFFSYVAQTIDPGADVATITFPLPNNGPTFVSPAQSTFVVWQYMPVPTISFSAVGTGPIVYFVSALPVGLSWDSATHSVSGSCMRTGTQTFAVYAKDGLGGITAFQVTLLVEVPRILKKQTSAGAYTSLVRQYTEVNAAQTARDSRALPDQTTGIGEFASPYPPSVVTPSNCPC